MNTIAELESELRERVLEIGQDQFTAKRWYQIVAALDNIGDTALALEGFRRSGLGRSWASQYLRLFGVLQCVFMQQDSIGSLHNFLLGKKLHPPKDSAWSEIRDLRNLIGGHPAERAGAVARTSIERGVLLVMCWKDDAQQTNHIAFSSLLSEYRQEATVALSELLSQITNPVFQPPSKGEAS